MCNHLVHWAVRGSVAAIDLGLVESVFCSVVGTGAASWSIKKREIIDRLIDDGLGS